MVASDRPRRWPAYALAVLFLGYAAGKAVVALEARLGFPGGPAVSAAEHEAYFMNVSVAQWLAVASGLLGACVVVATVTPVGRRVPLPLMLPVLGVMLLAVGGGAGTMVLDGFVGIGVGWQWYHGMLGLIVIALFLETIRSYVAATRRATNRPGTAALSSSGTAAGRRSRR
ncbi:hypothetical protein AB0C18_22635 [Nonomuraea muscovyensis]|uniref:hypothetical protein n=1 Tax=Nonomuraea muscovyensis TaxID=1124761 RepID=UPI0033D72E3D